MFTHLETSGNRSRQTKDDARRIGDYERPVAMLFEKSISDPHRAVDECDERLNPVSLMTGQKSTTEHRTNQDVLNTTAGITVKGDESVLVASAGKNVELVGATLSALGKNGNVLLSAGENITLDTKKLQSQKDMTENAENYLRTKRGTELGTEIRADGNISIAAGNDLKARAAAIASTEGTTSLAAGKDITLTAGRETAEDHYGHRHTASGFLSSTRKTIRIDNATDEARGTLVTGKDVNLAAKQDVTLQAANVLADNNTNIAAGRNFTAASEENYAHTDSFKEEKTSGIFSSGGLGFTIGTQQVKSERDSSALTQAGTNIAGFAGDVKITAGDTAHLTSASILAGKNASITAKETQIDGRENIYRDVLTQESRTTGLTVSLGHGLLSLGQEIAAPLQRMGEVKDDRLKAVYAWKAGRLIHENFGKGQNPLKDAAGFSLNLNLGTSKSYSRTESVTREYAGSKIAAGEKADLAATERDLTIQGSKVEGKDVALTAKQNIQLTAGENSNRTTTQNKASSAGIGVSFSPQGLSGLSLHASKAQGNSRENASTYTPTEIAAKDALQIESGKDTNILGSTVQGDKVTAKIGGNLNIETLQEKETYEEKNTSAGFDLSWDIRAGKFSKPTFGLSAGRGTIDSHYRSARGQSGIFAGKGGFDIYVEKNTDLKGAVIASEANKEKNRLSTRTFSFSGLKNGADYSAKSIGAEYHHYGSYDKMSRQEKNKVYNTIGLSPSLSMPAKGDANSTTTSAVAPGTIDIRENPTQDISALSRDTANTLNELGRIFDKQKIEEQQELAKAFGEEAFRLAHNLPDDGSGRKVAVHAIIGGIMSQITGAGFASGAIGAGVNEAIIGEIKKIKDPGTAQIVSAIVGAAAAKAVGGNAGSGASAAASGTKWNYLLEWQYRRMQEELSKAVTEDEKSAIRERWAKVDKAQEDRMRKDMAKDEYAIRSTDNEEIARQKEKNFEALYGEQHYTLDGNVYKNLPDTIVVPSKEQKGTTDDGDKKSLGKTVAIETFKAEADRPVTLYNTFSNNSAKALKWGIFAPLGFGYDMYQDYGQYSGLDFGKVTLINSGAFIFSSIADGFLIESAGLTIEATILANIAIAEGANRIKKNWARSDEEKQEETP